MTLRVLIAHDEPSYPATVVARVFDPLSKHCTETRVLGPGESTHIYVHTGQSIQLSEGAPLPHIADPCPPPVVNAGPPQTDPPQPE